MKVKMEDLTFLLLLTLVSFSGCLAIACDATWKRVTEMKAKIQGLTSKAPRGAGL